jgi:pyoverdine/dityrosine biosynthesis protein Dit1
MVTLTQDRALRSRLRILEAATGLFATQGFDATAVRDVAAQAGLSVGLVCRYFPTREHLALAIFERLADELARVAVELPRGTVAERFRALMTARLGQCEAHRRTLTALVGKALDPQSPLYTLGAATEGTRAKVHGALAVLVSCASDAPGQPADRARLAQLLYSVHLGVVLAALAQPSTAWAGALLEQVCRLLKWAKPSLPLLRRLLGDGWDGLLLDRPRLSAGGEAVSREILARLFRDNRVLPGVAPGLTDASEALHRPMIESFVRAKAPIELVLPAFPAKAPNPHKVLGPLPDLAEQRALERLSELLDSIEAVWKPGARLTLCSDGHVFADAVGVSDADVDRYRAALLALIDDERVSWFDLSTAFGDEAPALMRKHLMERHAPSEASLRARAASSSAFAAQVDGIHRFLFEDEVVLKPAQTRSQSKKLTRDRAWEVVRRSEAWGALVASVFPQALRLSIHPQPDPSTKIGVNLLGVADPWLTPWHAAAVVDKTGTRLMHRADAEALGAKLVLDGGRPSHLELP